MLTALYAVWPSQPDLFYWPFDDSKRVRFKLDRIAPLNGFGGHNAHDALGDLLATIHIVRLIAQRAPAIWEELLSNRDKRHVQARLETFQPMALVERFGGGPPRATLGCFCGYSASNPNQRHSSTSRSLVRATCRTPMMQRFSQLSMLREDHPLPVGG